jgi:carbonic anhydrase
MPLSHTAQRLPFPKSAFDDVIQANTSYAVHHNATGLTGVAARGLAVVTCMDSRIDPLSVLGMAPGDVKILRNAGARVTEDVMRTLVLASYLLGVTRILVMPHTDCRMASAAEWEVHEQIMERFGVDTRSVEFRTETDQIGALITDVTRLRAYPLLPQELVVAGALLDITTGRLEQIDA